MNIEKHRHHYFEGLQLSSDEFYALVEQTIKDRNYPKVECSRVSFSTGGFLSEKREYLKVKRNEFHYLICAAPFGKDCFISYWLREAESAHAKIAAKVPLVGKYLARVAESKTFYELDAELLFKESITNVIEGAIARLNASTGFRQKTGPEEVVN